MKRLLFLLPLLALVMSCVSSRPSCRRKNSRRCYSVYPTFYVYNKHTTIVQYNMYYIYDRDTITLDTKAVEDIQTISILEDIDSELNCLYNDK